MLLRSSSTPILGSLLPESPTNNHHHPSFCCHLSPLPDSSPSPGFRRTRSDGNLHSLLPEEPHHSLKRPNPVLESIPSFCFYGPNHAIVQDEEEEAVDEEERKEKGEEVSYFEESEETRRSGTIGKQSALYLARGLGIDRVASGLMDSGCEGSGCGGDGFGGGSCGLVAVDGGGGEKSDTEMYYKRMVEDDPSNALVLRNYAQFLYEKKGDPQRAEEYYSRAILAGPGDGEILSKYAKLVWELHHDEERASTYFARAVEAAPQDSYVLAAYARFLWETEEDDEGEGRGNAQSKDNNGNPIHVGALASASA